MKDKFLKLGREYFATQKVRFDQWIGTKKAQLTSLIKKYGYKTALAIFVGMLLFHKDVHVQVDKGNVPLASILTSQKRTQKQSTMAKASLSALPVTPVSTPQKTGVFQYQIASEKKDEIRALPETESGFWSSKVNSRASTATKRKWRKDGTLANTYSNLTYHTAKRTLSPEEQRKRHKQWAYIQRFKKVALAEADKYGIPASITLAQGLLESNVGESRLATRNNNHFGIKCFSRSCRKGHCSNFTDDSHKDFFRKYNSAWESYRAHSKMLNGKRYQHLQQLKKTDYKAWARGLKKAGYATDKRYADKLINLIEELDLHQFDV